MPTLQEIADQLNAGSSQQSSIVNLSESDKQELKSSFREAARSQGDRIIQDLYPSIASIVKSSSDNINDEVESINRSISSLGVTMNRMADGIDNLNDSIGILSGYQFKSLGTLGQMLNVLQDIEKNLEGRSLPNLLSDLPAGRSDVKTDTKNADKPDVKTDTKNADKPDVKTDTQNTKAQDGSTSTKSSDTGSNRGSKSVTDAASTAASGAGKGVIDFVGKLGRIVYYAETVADSISNILSILSDQKLNKSQKQKAVAVELGRLAAQIGTVEVGMIVGAAIAGAISIKLGMSRGSLKTAILTFGGGIAGGTVAGYYLSDSIDDLAHKLTDYLVSTDTSMINQSPNTGEKLNSAAKNLTNTSAADLPAAGASPASADTSMGSSVNGFYIPGSSEKDAVRVVQNTRSVEPLDAVQQQYKESANRVFTGGEVPADVIQKAIKNGFQNVIDQKMGTVIYRADKIIFDANSITLTQREQNKLSEALKELVQPSVIPSTTKTPDDSETTSTMGTGTTTPMVGSGLTTGGGGGGGTGGGSGKSAPSDTLAQNKQLPVEARALLDTIASGESAGKYGAINYMAGGGEVKDFSQHPFTGQKGVTAAGRYQMLASNWDKYSKKLGLKDWSPENQDIAAWALAIDDYSARTGGRDLEQDLKNPDNIERIREVLSPTWLALNNMRNTQDLYSKNLKRQQESDKPKPEPVESKSMGPEGTGEESRDAVKTESQTTPTNTSKPELQPKYTDTIKAESQTTPRDAVKTESQTPLVDTPKPDISTELESPRDAIKVESQTPLVDIPRPELSVESPAVLQPPAPDTGKTINDRSMEVSANRDRQEPAVILQDSQNGSGGGGQGGERDIYRKSPDIDHSRVGPASAPRDILLELFGHEDRR